MPRDNPLPPSVVADFETWVRMGAPNPRVSESAAAVFQKVYEKTV